MRLPLFAEKVLYQTNKVVGVELIFHTETDFIINACVCKRKGTSVEITETLHSVTLDRFCETISKDIPIVVVINGKGIIQKKSSLSEQDNFSTSFHKIFATGNENDFYTQIYSGLQGNGYVSVIRKEKADEIIQKLKEKGFSVINLFIGPFIIESALVLATKNIAVFDLAWESHNVTIEDGKIKEYTTLQDSLSSEKVELGDFSVDSFTFIAFSAAFHYFVPVTEIKISASNIQYNALEYKNSRAFTLLLRTSVIGILLICLVNFFVFSNYFEKQKGLDAELAVYQNSISQYELLNKEKKNKSDFLEKSGLAYSTKTSFYTDRLLYDLPDEIQLTYLQVSPFKNKLEKDSVPKFDNKLILIKGECQKSIILNNWINLIKTKDFISDATLDNYELNSEKGNGKFNLTVKLK